MAQNDITLTFNPHHRSEHRSEVHYSDESTDEGDSSGTGVHLSPPSAVGSQDSFDKDFTDSAEEDRSWDDVSREPDLGPSESASRPGTSNRHRAAVPEAPRPEVLLRRSSRAEPSQHVRIAHHHPPPHRAHRQPQPSSLESVDPNEEYLAYGPEPPRQRRPYGHWVAAAGGQSYPYQQHYSQPGYPSYPGTGLVTTSGQQLVPFASPSSQYPYSPYQQGGGGPGAGYFQHGHPGGPAPMSHHMAPPGGASYGSPDPMQHPGMPQGYFPYTQPGYALPHALAPSPVYQTYQPVYAPPPVLQTTPPSAHTPPPPQPPPPAEPPKNDEAYSKLEKLIMDERAERAAREIAAKQAEDDRIAKAAADKKYADDLAAAAAEATAKATTEAEKKAAQQAQEAAEAAVKKAKEEAEKAKKEAEAVTKRFKEEAAEKEAAEAAAVKAKADMDAAIAKARADLEAEAAAKAADAAAKAAAEAETAAKIEAAVNAAKMEAAVKAAAPAPPPPPPAEKQKPIKFKDAVGRKFSFPFHLCATWAGMKDLIDQAFLHVEGIGPHVLEGHYDLVGPNNDIILPAVWETVIEPDWAITMHLWPMPEPKVEEPPPIDVPGPPPIIVEKKPKGKMRRATKPPPPPPPPPLFGAVVDVPIGLPPPPPPAPPPPPPPAPSLPLAGLKSNASKGKKPARKGGFSLFGGPAKPKPKPAAKKPAAP